MPNASPLPAGYAAYHTPVAGTPPPGPPLFGSPKSGKRVGIFKSWINSLRGKGTPGSSAEKTPKDHAGGPRVDAGHPGWGPQHAASPYTPADAIMPRANMPPPAPQHGYQHPSARDAPDTTTRPAGLLPGAPYSHATAAGHTPVQQQARPGQGGYSAHATPGAAPAARPRAEATPTPHTAADSLAGPWQSKRSLTFTPGAPPAQSPVRMAHSNPIIQALLTCLEECDREVAACKAQQAKANTRIDLVTSLLELMPSAEPANRRGGGDGADKGTPERDNDALMLRLTVDRLRMQQELVHLSERLQVLEYARREWQSMLDMMQGVSVSERSGKALQSVIFNEGISRIKQYERQLAAARHTAAAAPATHHVASTPPHHQQHHGQHARTPSGGGGSYSLRAQQVLRTPQHGLSLPEEEPVEYTSQAGDAPSEASPPSLAVRMDRASSAAAVRGTPTTSSAAPSSLATPREAAAATAAAVAAAGGTPAQQQHSARAAARAAAAEHQLPLHMRVEQAMSRQRRGGSHAWGASADSLASSFTNSEKENRTPTTEQEAAAVARAAAADAAAAAGTHNLLPMWGAGRGAGAEGATAAIASTPEQEAAAAQQDEALVTTCLNLARSTVLHKAPQGGPARAAAAAAAGAGGAPGHHEQGGGGMAGARDLLTEALVIVTGNNNVQDVAQALEGFEQRIVEDGEDEEGGNADPSCVVDTCDTSYTDGEQPQEPEQGFLEGAPSSAARNSQGGGRNSRAAVSLRDGVGGGASAHHQQATGDSEGCHAQGSTMAPALYGQQQQARRPSSGRPAAAAGHGGSSGSEYAAQRLEQLMQGARALRTPLATGAGVSPGKASGEGGYHYQY